MDNSNQPAGFKSPAPEALSMIVDNAFSVLATVGEEFLELVVALVSMILVERAYGPPGLGIFAYLSSCLYIVRYFAGCGVARHVEREIAVLESQSRAQKAAMAAGFKATVFTGIAAAIFLVLSAGFDRSHTHIQESIVAYLVLALIIPQANLNHLKLSILQGAGHHARVARLRMVRHGLFLAGLLILAQVRVRPSWLLIACLPADLVVGILIRRSLRLPAWWKAFKINSRVRDTLKNGYAYLFTDNALDLLLNIDVFVLGLFVGAQELGIYAEVAVLVRIALLLPVAVKPILRRRYGLMLARQQSGQIKAVLGSVTVWMFCLNAALAVFTMLYFNTILDFFFVLKNTPFTAFKVFAIYVPGLIFFGALTAQEPIYDTIGGIHHLKRLTLITAGINLLLTLYFVPMAGISGAATATMISMLVYFVLFGWHQADHFGLRKCQLTIAGLAIYLVYVILDHMAWTMAVTLWLAPLMLILLFYLIGLFGVREKSG